MACFLNPAFWTYLIVVIGMVAIARIVFPWIVSFFGFPDPIGRVLMIILWIAIAIVGVYFLFGLIGCFGSLSIPTFPHGR